MSIEYNAVTALHYAAYRPALHEVILQRCLGEKKFRNGLDMGCGTGVSTVALKRFCHRVTGADPSKKMISQAVDDTQIEYYLLKDETIPFPENTFDICTYAGSWWYGKSQALLNETIRVCRAGATILIYDFELDLKPIYDTLHLVPTNLEGYDHSANFEGLDTTDIQIASVHQEQRDLLLSPIQIAHMLCSEEPMYAQLVERFESKDPFEELVEVLKNSRSSAKNRIKASIHYSYYIA